MVWTCWYSTQSMMNFLLKMLIFQPARYVIVYQVVVWNICLFSSRKLGKWSNLTIAYFSDGWGKTTNKYLNQVCQSLPFLPWVQWKITHPIKGNSYWRYTHFPRVTMIMGGRGRHQVWGSHQVWDTQKRLLVVRLVVFLECMISRSTSMDFSGSCKGWDR